MLYGENDWRAQLKVGDEVLIDYPGWGDTRYLCMRNGKVVKATATQVTVSEGGRMQKFVRRTGDELGRARSSRCDFIRQPKPDVLAEMENAKRTQELLRRIGNRCEQHNIRHLPVATLEFLADALDRLIPVKSEATTGS